MEPVQPVIKQSNFLVTLLSILLSISVFIAGFFAFQTQNLVKELTKLQVTPTPIATIEPDPTTSWKTYKNYLFSISYPSDVKLKEWTDSYGRHILLSKSDSRTKNPSEPINDLGLRITTNVLNKTSLELFVDERIKNVLEVGSIVKGKTAMVIDNRNGYEFTSSGLEISRHIFVMGSDNRYLEIADSTSTTNQDHQKIANQILSTFKFTEPVACTMEAKVCPDGSFVGRSGPKCEFAPCPTPLN